MKEEEIKLVQNAQKGDAESFGKLYDTYVSPIYRFIYLKTSHKEDAEDLTHQVFLNAWQNIKNFQFQGFPFGSWLYKIAGNSVIDYYRTKKYHLNIETVPEHQIAESFEVGNALDNSFDGQMAHNAISRLEPDQQNVIIMKFVNDLSNKEIATALNKSEGAIRVIQHRALKQLKNFLERDNHSTTKV